VAPFRHAQFAVAAERVEGLVLFKPLDDRPENARVALWRAGRTYPRRGDSGR
jgi:hypothetical protein